jgi:spore coat protein U-like protein
VKRRGTRIRRTVWIAPGAAVCALLLSAKAQAVFLGSCSVAATAVGFGVYTPLTQLNSTGTVSVTCSGVSLPTLVPVVIALNAGSGGGTFAARLMASGANTLSYNLYTDSNAMNIWGDGTGGSVVANATVSVPIIGSGQTNVTVFGRIPATQDPAPSAYTDTITVTVSY